ncbi:MAG: hypothetical protein CFE24_12355 [Flavobacterium sp. BFFFF2]|nr:MAG: hypothetical protein CFE24_12355 [Flavobacterium sp. BFFFF2]
MQNPSLNYTVKALLFVFAKLLAASLLISYFKSEHYAIGSLFLGLILIAFVRSYRRFADNRAQFWVATFGICITLLLGLMAEIWGTSQGHWQYLAIPNDIAIPFWVPFAWGLSYKTIYSVEKVLLPHFSNGLGKWLVGIVLPALVLPILGEIIVINNGTWHYTWQPQWLGMPLIPVVLLVVFHVSIVILMCGICKWFSVKDPVYAALVDIK